MCHMFVLKQVRSLQLDLHSICIKFDIYWKLSCELCNVGLPKGDLRVTRGRKCDASYKVNVLCCVYL